MAQQDVTKKFIELQLVGYYFSTNHGRDANGNKVYFTVDAAKRDNVAKPEESPLVIRYKNGRPFGKLEMATNKNKVMQIPVEETSIIEALSYHENINSEVSTAAYPKIMLVDPNVAIDAKRAKTQKRKIVDTIWANLVKATVSDIAAVKGWAEVDMEEKLLDLKDASPDDFLAFFKEPIQVGENGWKADLKESVKVSAILKRAILAGVVTTQAGALYFEEEQLGTDFDNAVVNMQDTDKKGAAKFLTLIKAKMK